MARTRVTAKATRGLETTVELAKDYIKRQLNGYPEVYEIGVEGGMGFLSVKWRGIDWALACIHSDRTVYVTGLVDSVQEIKAEYNKVR